MTPQQRHDLANLAQAVFWAIEQNKRDDALAELEIFFDEIHAKHVRETNDAGDRIAKSHAELDDIRKALGIESGQPILPAIEAFKDLIADLERWKKEQLFVESQWDCQRVGKLLGVGIGEHIRCQIEPKITALLEELTAYRKGGITEEILRRNDGRIKVGHGCAIVVAAEYDELRARAALTQSH